MRNYILQLATVCLLCNVAFAGDSGVEAYVYGLSYHTNRDYDFNELNYGLGLGFYTRPEDCPVYLAGQFSMYRDSFSNPATVFTVGPRWVLGNENKFHTDLSIQVGMIKTGPDKSLPPYNIIMPTVSFGYDRYNVHFVYIPEMGKSDPVTDPASDVYAMFLRIRLN
jgi:hypothetical protein